MRAFVDHLQVLKLLVEADVQGALRYLNGLTRYRFTGLYLFGDNTNQAWCLVDRDNPEPDPSLLESRPLEHSYCAMVRDRRSGLRIEDSEADDRYAGHPNRFVRAYWGTPVKDAFGIPIGALCHFDFEPVARSDDDQLIEDLLEEVAPLLSMRLAGAKR